MEFNEVVLKRKSIRAYKNTVVSKEEVIEMIQSAQLAPTWKNSQTPRYYVVQSEEMVKKMQEVGLAPFNAQRTKEVSTYIVVTFKKNISGFNDDETPTNEMGQGWGYYDAGIATNQLILKAAEMGYGSLIMGIRDEKVIRQFLEVPEDEIITSVISIGQAEVTPERNPRKDYTEVSFFK